MGGDNSSIDKSIQIIYNICMQVQIFNISLPKGLVKKADQIAKKEYRSRSDLIREALRNYLDEKSEWKEIFKIGKKAMKNMGIKNEKEINQTVYEYRHGQQQG